MSDEAPVLAVNALTKRFGGLSAVNEVTFEVRAGEILGLIGPNGSGKSTVINLISGLYKPSNGDIFFKGRRITGLSAPKIAALGISRTFQLLRLFAGLTVSDNALAGTHRLGSHDLLGAVVGGFAVGAEERDLRRRAADALEFFGLTERGSVPAAQVTSGEGRLLEGARALASDADLILLDEPAAGLNTSETEVLEERLQALRDRGKSLLLVEHDMRLVMRLASRVVVLNEGRLLAEGSPNEIQANEKVIRVYLGTGDVQRRRRRDRREAGVNGPA